MLPKHPKKTPDIIEAIRHKSLLGSISAFSVNGKQIELLDHSKLIEELRRLKRRPGRTGKDGFDHPPRLSDDIANSVARVSWLLKRRG